MDRFRFPSACHVLDAICFSSYSWVYKFVDKCELYASNSEAAGDIVSLISESNKLLRLKMLACSLLHYD